MRPAVTRADRRDTKLIFITRNAIASSYISPRANPLIAVGGEIVAQQATKILLRAAGRRPIVIG